MVEFLLVLGIIALLGGLIFAGGSMARKRVDLVACQGNLHQLGVAVRMYVSDHGTLPLVRYGGPSERPRRPPSPPRGHNISVALGGYVEDRGVLYCPATRRFAPAQPYDFPQTNSGLRLSQVKTPKHRALIMTDIWDQPRTRQSHGGSRNVLFLDGHVKAYRGPVWVIPIWQENDESTGWWPKD